MKRRKLPSYKDAGRKHHARTDFYVSRYLTEMGDRLAVDAVQLIDRLGVEIDPSEVFSFAKHPEMRAGLQKMRAGYATQLRALILNGVAREWAEASNLQDEMASAVLNARGVLDEAKDIYPMLGRPNEEALSAFIARRDKGMWLSQRIWNLSGATQTQLEAALATGIEGGWDAVTLSKRVSKYLHDYPSLQKDYTERFGHATHILDAEYRSARLARTEINIAYRSAEQQRWGELDFVRGYEVKRSGRGYDCPVCQDLSGKYPKDFVWAGWHPNCRCYAIPILNTEEEFFSHKTSSQNDVTDTPENFKEWIEANRERLGRANERGTLPYFVRDNPHYVQRKKVQEEPKQTPAERSKERQAKRTPEERKAIQERWDKRNAIRKKEEEELRLAKEYDVYRDFSKQGGGQVKISKLLSREDKAKADYQQIKQVADLMARQGADVTILPRVHAKSPAYREIYGTLIGTDYERKCPDLLIDGKFYEFESYVRPWKKSKVRRMISHGLDQSPNIIIDNSKGCSHRHIKRIVEERIRTRKNGQPIHEVWVYERGELNLIYRHTEG